MEIQKCQPKRVGTELAFVVLYLFGPFVLRMCASVREVGPSPSVWEICPHLIRELDVHPGGRVESKKVDSNDLGESDREEARRTERMTAKKRCLEERCEEGSATCPMREAKLCSRFPLGSWVLHMVADQVSNLRRISLGGPILDGYLYYTLRNHLVGGAVVLEDVRSMKAGCLVGRRRTLWWDSIVMLIKSLLKSMVGGARCSPESRCL